MDSVNVFCCDSYDIDKISEIIESIFKETLYKKFDSLEDKKIFIKVNMVNGYSPSKAATTHPCVVEAIVRILAKHKAKIYFGDSSMSDSKNAFLKCGYTQIAQKYNAVMCPLEDMGYSYTDIKKADVKNLPTVPLSDMVKDMDYIINVPKLKLHYSFVYTGAVKNLYGLIPGKIKLQIHGKLQTKKEFQKFLVYLPQISNIDLNIMDAVVGMEGNGPTNGKPKKTGYILSSENIYNIDVVAMKIIGIELNDVEYMVNAINKGYAKRFEDIDINGSFNTVKYKKPYSIMGGMDKFVYNHIPFIYNRIIRPRAHIIKDRCKRCGKCIEHCPEKAISRKKGAVVVNRKRCISCFCCQECCPHNAIIGTSLINSKLILKNKKGE